MFAGVGFEFRLRGEILTGGVGLGLLRQGYITLGSSPQGAIFCFRIFRALD